MTVGRPVHQIIRTGHHPRLTERRQRERTFPVVAPVVRVVEPRRSAVDVLKPHRHAEVGMREIDRLGDRDRLRFFVPGIGRAVPQSRQR